uniref:Golgi associated RAB2 interactor protein-like Rab2B-binding domain-containing protein n=1 Tax=Accipiter nisus TaxID=211598 RepID=A0A8B9MN98_9AVES
MSSQPCVPSTTASWSPPAHVPPSTAPFTPHLPSPPPATTPQDPPSPPVPACAASRVTVGIAATSPLLPLPDLMLLARPVPASPPDTEELQLFGLLPLSCVRLSLHSRRRHQLRARLVTGRTFYLQLLASPRRLRRLFARWIRLLFLLRDAKTSPAVTP